MKRPKPKNAAQTVARVTLKIVVELDRDCVVSREALAVAHFRAEDAALRVLLDGDAGGGVEASARRGRTLSGTMGVSVVQAPPFPPPALDPTPESPAPSPASNPP